MKRAVASRPELHAFATQAGPLHRVDARLCIVESAGAGAGSLVGQPCWEVFGCGIARREDCRAIRLGAASAGAPREAVASSSHAVCLLLGLPGQAGEALLWCPMALPAGMAPNSFQIQAGLHAALAAGQGRSSLRRALNWLCHILCATECAVLDARRRDSPPLFTVRPRPLCGDPGASLTVRLGTARGAAGVAIRLKLPAHVAQLWPAERMRHALWPIAAAWPAVAVRAAAPPPAAEHALTSSLSVRCLGPFEVRVNGEPLPRAAFVRREARVLLMMLAMHAGKLVHRDRLVDWLWPGADPDGARNRLHGLVHALRAAIEPARGRAEGWTYLLSEGPGYMLSAGPQTRLDVLRFREGIAQARAAARSGSPAPERIRLLEQALSLYRGDFLEDELEADWCIPERADLAEAAAAGMSELARLHESEGNRDQSIVWLRKALGVDPLREEMHYRLISLLLEAGRHAEARRQCRAAQRVLREELGIEPRPEFKALLLALNSRSAGETG